jgi:hypothetical protein
MNIVIVEFMLFIFDWFYSPVSPGFFSVSCNVSSRTNCFPFYYDNWQTTGARHVKMYTELDYKHICIYSVAYLRHAKL